MTPSSNNKARKSKVPYLFIGGGALVLAIAAGLLLRAPSPAEATPSFLALAEAQYPFIVGSRIDTCDLCHVPNAIPSLNAYGTAFLDHGLNAAALVAIENLDSDQDGFTNIQELRAFTFPGNPNDHPAANTATATRTATRTSLPTTAPSNTPTRTPTRIPTTGPTATATMTTLPSNTVAPTQASTASSTPLPSGTVSPTQTATATLTPVPSTGPVSPTATVQCQADNERNEHFKKSHGKSKESMAAEEEANEEKFCEGQEDEASELNEGHESEGNEVEEAHESSQAELHEQENEANEINEANESDQADMGEQENQDQQDSQGQQESLGSDQAFFSSIDLWLSQWIINAGFHD